ncbi:MAG: hypothetical protein WCJ30_10560 [Deltaproteobacteria bacterium]
MIERSGGVLEAEEITSQSPVLVRRYWIELGGAPPGAAGGGLP